MSMINFELNMKKFYNLGARSHTWSQGVLFSRGVNCRELPLMVAVFCQFLPCHHGPPWSVPSANWFIICSSTASLEHSLLMSIPVNEECIGSVVECFTRDSGVSGWSLTILCPWARNFILCLVVVQPWKNVNWDVKNQSEQTNIPAKLLS